MRNWNAGKGSLALAAVMALAAWLAVVITLTPTGAGTAYGQEATPTPGEPTATPAPPPPTSTPAPPSPTNTPPPTNTPVPTWTPEPTWTPVPTNSPVPTNTPPPTFTPVPVQPQHIAPGGTIFINCGPGEPCIDLHSTHTNITVDQTAVLSFTIVNSLAKPDMLSRLILELPSGWSMDGEGFADKCSGLCSANYTIATGEQEFVEVTAYPNHTGKFRLAGRVEWVYAGTNETHHLTRDVPITVVPGAQGNVAPVTTPVPPTPVPTPTPAPQPEGQPTVIIVTETGGGGGGSSGGNCFGAPAETPTALEPSMLAVAGLILPGIAGRLGLSLWRRRRNGPPQDERLGDG